MSMKVHVAVSVTHLDTSIKFYELLGFSESKRYQHQTLNGEWALLEKEGFLLELFCMRQADKPTQKQPMTNPGLHHIGIQVQSIDTTLRKVNQETEIQQGTAVKRYAFITDPDNTLIELYEVMQ